MGKTARLLVVVALLAGVVWLAARQFGGSGEPAGGTAADARKPRLEEKYGYTSEGVGR
jgi:hypothetical protein